MPKVFDFGLALLPGCLSKTSKRKIRVLITNKNLIPKGTGLIPTELTSAVNLRKLTRASNKTENSQLRLKSFSAKKIAAEDFCNALNKWEVRKLPLTASTSFPAIFDAKWQVRGFSGISTHDQCETKTETDFENALINARETSLRMALLRLNKSVSWNDLMASMFKFSRSKRPMQSSLRTLSSMYFPIFRKICNYPELGEEAEEAIESARIVAMRVLARECRHFGLHLKNSLVDELIKNEGRAKEIDDIIKSRSIFSEKIVIDCADDENTRLAIFEGLPVSIQEEALAVSEGIRLNRILNPFRLFKETTTVDLPTLGEPASQSSTCMQAVGRPFRSEELMRAGSRMFNRTRKRICL